MPEKSYKYIFQKRKPTGNHLDGHAMPGLLIKQLQFEIDAWGRILRSIMDENVLLKIRLSDILKETCEPDLLEEVEGFQSSFVKEDELISLLRNDIAEFDKLLNRDNFLDHDRYTILEIQTKLGRLRNNIAIVEDQFNKLKMEFNRYLSHNLLPG